MLDFLLFPPDFSFFIFHFHFLGRLKKKIKIRASELVFQVGICAIWSDGEV